ncbi:uncharacterized protein BO88DRAFT_443673 [Aspergillus vadensis CBS 113365]|uniref:Uncharacterized protein n=1 Tax=Aspergillus vadensis (strain CBS 113365 / IMI 142717 / IBT 24658) TaxID=1448311 RepID=A0A319BAR1_ASPVC|nr:hypothetical protein BO88DRAFT_443673 [Aspergillus vadensis CBS 113365]PYH69685.1 hypothetical protein BO88DRAFT_443673 [Aspergillus vadensis CBS 113365]
MHILHLGRLSADIECTPPSLDCADVAVAVRLAARPMRQKVAKPPARPLLGAALPRESGAKLRRTRPVSAPVMIQWLEGKSEITVGGKSKIERALIQLREDKINGRKCPTEKSSREGEPLQYEDQPRDKGGTETLSYALWKIKDEDNRAMQCWWTSSSGYLEMHIFRANGEMQCGG